jgi:hypothetical protein
MVSRHQKYENDNQSIDVSGDHNYAEFMVPGHQQLQDQNQSIANCGFGTPEIGRSQPHVSITYTYYSIVVSRHQKYENDNQSIDVFEDHN